MSNATGVDEQIANAPRTFALQQNYPNPFSAHGTFGHPETIIEYQVPASAQVELMVYDLSGRRVATLMSAMKEAGEHLTQWSGRDNNGEHVANGVYFYRLTATSAQGKEIVLTRKLVLVR